MDRIRVAILGATGLVGQVFVDILSNHPWFEIVELMASKESAGKKYETVAKWALNKPIPEIVRDITVKETNPKELRSDVDLVFSALPSGIAKELEPKFAEKFKVISKASAYRMDNLVPLLIPEVNPEHLELIEIQQRKNKWDGFLITDPNCTTCIFMLSLKPIYDKFGVEAVIATSMQAISGAGYEGLYAMQIHDNIIPFIKGEEEKLKNETLKILGRIEDGKIIKPNIKISATCTRVPVIHGHTLSVSLKLRDKATVDEIKKTLASFKGLPQELNLPSAPKYPVIVRDEINRPQPRLDRNTYNGMAVTVGRIREDEVLDIKYIVTGHNLVRGAAGASILDAELLYKKGYL